MILPGPGPSQPALETGAYRDPGRPGHPVAVRENLVYGVGAVQFGRASVDLRIDAYLPEGLDDRRKAALVLLHGGGFVSGGKADLREEARWYAGRGLAVFSLDYRKLGDFPPVPRGSRGSLADYARAAVVDAKTALRYLHAHAGGLGIDPDAIFAGGVSAGAIAALAAGVTPAADFLTDLPGQPVHPSNHPGASMRVRGLLSFCGGLYGHLRAVTAGAPPILMVHGTDDATVPFSLAVALRDRCRETGVDHVFHAVEGGGHCPPGPLPGGRSLREVGWDFIRARLRREGGA